jgi:hypothetical protein
MHCKNKAHMYVPIGARWHGIFLKVPSANPTTTSEFKTTTPGYIERFFKVEENNFVFKTHHNSWRCNSRFVGANATNLQLQRHRCSRLERFCIGEKSFLL